MGLTPSDWLKEKDQMIKEGSKYLGNFLGKEGGAGELFKNSRRSSDLSPFGVFSCLDREAIKTHHHHTHTSSGLRCKEFPDGYLSKRQKNPRRSARDPQLALPRACAEARAPVEDRRQGEPRPGSAALSPPPPDPRPSLSKGKQRRRK